MLSRVARRTTTVMKTNRSLSTGVMLDAAFYLSIPAVTETAVKAFPSRSSPIRSIGTLLWMLSPIATVWMLDKMSEDDEESPTPAFDETKLPIVYHRDYNVSMFGLELLHAADSRRAGRVKDMLGLDEGEIQAPTSLPWIEERKWTSFSYRVWMRYAYGIARALEVAPIALMPSFLAQATIVDSQRRGASGSTLAVACAFSHPSKVGINLSGGYHHASGTWGHGFCLYPDLAMAVETAAKIHARTSPRPLRALVIDLDVHQGDGTALSLQDTSPLVESVVTIDFFNPNLFPAKDGQGADEIITYPVHVLPPDVREEEEEEGEGEGEAATPSSVASVVGRDKEYLAKVDEIFSNALEEYKPDVVIYNAGTDILQGDPLGGGVAISEEGIAERDLLVVKHCKQRDVPVVWLLSGGYHERSAHVIQNSIKYVNSTLQLNILPPTPQE